VEGREQSVENDRETEVMLDRIAAWLADAAEDIAERGIGTVGAQA